MTGQPPMDMFAQIQKMQADMQAAQDALANTLVDGTAGGGVVKATVTGDGELRKIVIDPSVVDPTDVETLEDLVVAAVHEAMRAAEEMQAQTDGRGHRRPRSRLADRAASVGCSADPRRRVSAVYEGPVQTLIDELGRLPGIGPEVGATHRVPLCSSRRAGREAPRTRDRRRQGPRHLVPALLQHLGGRAL